ncbi:MAG: threonylcarbamoyl-AMP synthase [Micavibrio sp.]|nr:threonylcarbamoyl-AMP synthase [Micavibrio sp.]|tara:strand:- start:2362 stop:3348 length:987 start_codon:yes stop_codon:yes gene_type:complete
MIKAPTPDSIKQAAQLIKDGHLVAIPTETVYGLAANALNGKAVAKIYEAKGRPNFNPLITHVANLEQAMLYGDFSDEAVNLAQQFWPGPLTIIVPQKTNSAISSLVTAGLKTIAIRVPNHPAALDLIKQSGLPLAAPSANKSGRLSSTTPAHVAEQFGDEVSMILAGGQAKSGLESTIIDMSGDTPAILRLGAITVEELEAVLGTIHKDWEAKEGHDVKSPGQLLKHYAPNTPIRLNAVDVKKGEALLGFGSLKFMGIEGGGFAKDLPETHLKNLSEERDLTEAASNLFAMLHALDKADCTAIAVMSIPNTGLGQAINDRLKRAATAS